MSEMSNNYIMKILISNTYNKRLHINICAFIHVIATNKKR